MSRKVMLTIAPTGGLVTKRENPALPTQPQEIADDVARCCALGASIAALHARLPDDEPTCRADIYVEINTLVADRCGIILNNSTGGGPGGDMLADLPDGRREVAFEARLGGIEAGAEMATLDAQTLSMALPGGDVLFQTGMDRAEALASRMRDRGIKPEWEIFSPADLAAVHALAPAYDSPPYYINVVLGAHKVFSGSMPYSDDILRFCVDLLPADSVFCVSGIGAAQLPATVQALLLGGHIRVGLEDNVFFAKGELATNQSLVQRAARIVRELNLELATPAEARDLLGLPAPRRR